MRIVVCVKQVPDTADVRIDPERGTLIRQGVESVLNPLDLYPVELAARLAAETDGEAIALSMGPPRAEEVCREAVARGCTDARLLTDRAFSGADTWSTSYVLARAIAALGGVDLVLCGKMAVDGDTAQVGPGIAAHLRWPQAVDCRGLSLAGDALRAELMTDYGDELVELPRPAVVTVLKEACVPRLPDLERVMAARRMAVPRIGADDLDGDRAEYGLKGSPTRVVKITTATLRGTCTMLEGDPAETVPRLIGELDRG